MTGGSRTLLASGLALAGATWVTRQCRKPSGWLGGAVVRLMNRSHRNLTSWGLQHAEIGRTDQILDVGCGGGRTLERLAEIAPGGLVVGIDYSEASAAASRQLNEAAIESGRIAVQQANVSSLPFADRSFHLVTAVETHYYWPSLAEDVREIYRVLKPGGTFLLIAEAYRGQRLDAVNGLAMKLLGGRAFTQAEHLKFLADAGYVETRAFVEKSKGWICVTGRRVS